MPFWTYIVASARNGTIYTGSTDDLSGRVHQHREKTLRGFTSKYGVHHLVWFEEHPSRNEAFRRERQIKEWKRAWRLNLIEGFNPDWLDLSDSLDPSPGHVPYPDEIAAPTTSKPLPRARPRSSSSAHPGEGRGPGSGAPSGGDPVATDGNLGPGLRRDERKD